MKKTLAILTILTVTLSLSKGTLSQATAQRVRTTAVFDADTSTRPKTGFYGVGVRSGNVFLVPATGTTKRLLAANTHVGTSGQYLYSNGTTNLWRTPLKADIGLGNVDNTSDLNKPISTATQTAINAKFTLPSLTSGSVLFSNGSTITQNNSQLFWDNTNNRLGIGTASPSQKLTVAGNIELPFGGDRFISIGSSTNYSYSLSSVADNFQILEAGSTPRLTIKYPNGNVGIGTTAPTSKLQVVGLPTYADNAAATSGGLTAGAFYRTSTGVLMVVY